MSLTGTLITKLVTLLLGCLIYVYLVNIGWVWYAAIGLGLAVMVLSRVLIGLLFGYYQGRQMDSEHKRWLRDNSQKKK